MADKAKSYYSRRVKALHGRSNSRARKMDIKLIKAR